MYPPFVLQPLFDNYLQIVMGPFKRATQTKQDVFSTHHVILLFGSFTPLAVEFFLDLGCRGVWIINWNRFALDELKHRALKTFP